MGVVEPFSVAVADATLDDLHDRLRRARLPRRWVLDGEEDPARLERIRSLAERWCTDFDWRAWEGVLNAREQHLVEVDGTRLHVVRAPAARAGAPALLLLNGWPSSVLEYLGVLDALAEDFDVVVASRPGYGFSDAGLDRRGDDEDAAALMTALMTGALGHRSFLVHGDDFGGTVASWMGLQAPRAVRAIHVAEWLEADPAALDPPATEAERLYLDGLEDWRERERGYGHVQATRPQTLGLALEDSPVGLLAWVADKWLSWVDPAGPGVDDDLLLATATLYWVTGSMTTSMRPYATARPPRPGERVAVPAAAIAAREDRAAPPRSWLERTYADLRSYEILDRGGHFLAAEDPGAFSARLRRTFAAIAG